MNIRPIAGRIAFVLVELDDGRWTRFSKEDIETASQFALTSNLTYEAEPRIWQLLEFITSLGPEPLDESETTA